MIKTIELTDSQSIVRHQGLDLWQVVDPRGVELWLPPDLKLTVCSLCSRYCTTRVAIAHRSLVQYYQSKRHLPERAARRHMDRPICRECMDYSSKALRGPVGVHDRKDLTDIRLKVADENE